MKKIHPVYPPAADAKFVGDEPTWDPATFDVSRYVKEMMRGLNWHNYVAKDSDLHKYLIEWASRHAPDRLKAIEALPSTKVDGTIAAICRMHVQGFPLKPHHLEQITGYLETISQPKVSTPVATPEKPRGGNVQEAMRLQVAGTLSDLDEAIDVAFQTFEIDPPKITDLILQKQYTSRHLVIIRQVLSENIAEWIAAYDNTDAQLREAYLFVPRRKFRRLIDGFTEVVKQIQTYTERTKTPRKPRPVNKSKVAKNLKFLATYDKFIGLPASEVVEATVVWIYDTKYRKLIRLVGEKKGLSAKGASITGAQTAESKLLRKPELQLLQFTATKGKTTHAWYDNLTTKTAKAGLRITPTMILLRVE